MRILFSELVKIGLAASAVMAVLGFYVLSRLRKSEALGSLIDEPGLFKLKRLSFSARQLALAFLVVFSGLSICHYYRFSDDVVLDDYDGYDILHYYLNAKFSDELGYDLLYPALLVVDRETINRFEGKITKYRHAPTHGYRARSQALEMGEEIKARFGPERWKEFAGDYLHIQDRISSGMWKTILQDRGYNATPIWNMIGRVLANAVPVQDLKLLCLLDLVVLTGMFVAVYWAFGLEALAFGLIFVAVGYSFRWPVVGWSVLRYDWLAALVASSAFLRRGYYKSAGVLLGYATCMRIFPAVFTFGLIAKGIGGVIANRDVPWKKLHLRVASGVPRHYWITAASMVVTIAVLSSAAIARDGAQSFANHFDDLEVHLRPENLSSQRCGLGTALVFDNTEGTSKGYIPGEKKLEVGEKTSLKYAIAFVLLLLLGIGATRLEDHEALLLGFIPFYLLSIASYYYYSMRMTVVVMHAAGLAKPRNAVGLGLLFAIEVVVWIAELVGKSRYFAVGWMGWSLAAYSLVMIIWLFWQWWRSRQGVERS